MRRLHRPTLPSYASPLAHASDRDDMLIESSLWLKALSLCLTLLLWLYHTSFNAYSIACSSVSVLPSAKAVLSATSSRYGRVQRMYEALPGSA